MRIEKLDKDTRAKIYREHMLQDFHEEEVKPLALLERLTEQGLYLCCGCFDGKIPVGYMYFAKAPDSDRYLLDYYAIYPEYRSKGYGSKILAELKTGNPDVSAFGDVMIAEVEDPDYSENEADRDLRERRIGFYKRNGLRALQLRSRVLGAHYIIMLLEPANRPPMAEREAADTLTAIYKTVFGAAFFEKNIEIAGV